MLTALHQSESPPVTCTHTDDDPSWLRESPLSMRTVSMMDITHLEALSCRPHQSDWRPEKVVSRWISQLCWLSSSSKVVFSFSFPFSFGHYTRPYLSPPSIYTCTVWMNKTFCKCYTPYSMAYESTMPTSFWIHLRQSLFKMTTASGRITIWLAHLPFSIFSFFFWAIQVVVYIWAIRYVRSKSQCMKTTPSNRFDALTTIGCSDRQLITESAHTMASDTTSILLPRCVAWRLLLFLRRVYIRVYTECGKRTINSFNPRLYWLRSVYPSIHHFLLLFIL